MEVGVTPDVDGDDCELLLPGVAVGARLADLLVRESPAQNFRKHLWVTQDFFEGELVRASSTKED